MFGPEFTNILDHLIVLFVFIKAALDALVQICNALDVEAVALLDAAFVGLNDLLDEVGFSALVFLINLNFSKEFSLA